MEQDKPKCDWCMDVREKGLSFTLRECFRDGSSWGLGLVDIPLKISDISHSDKGVVFEDDGKLRKLCDSKVILEEKNEHLRKAYRASQEVIRRQSEHVYYLQRRLIHPALVFFVDGYGRGWSCLRRENSKKLNDIGQEL